ncbi:hypothetical protein AAHB62_28625 [Bacillus cereus]
MGKYQLDSKSQVAVAKFHEKQKPAKFDKKQQLEKLRTEYLKRSKNKQINNTFCFSNFSVYNANKHKKIGKLFIVQIYTDYFFKPLTYATNACVSSLRITKKSIP